MNKLKNFCKKHASQILTTAGIVGYAGCAFLSARAYKECCNRLDQRKQELQVAKLPVKEVIKTCAGPCAPAVLAFATSTACVLGAQNHLMKENAGLLVALKGTETTLSEVYTQTKAIAGEETYNQIREKVAEKQIEQTPAPVEKEEEPAKKTYIDDAKELYWDATYGGYFYATELDIYKAFEKINTEMKAGFSDYALLSNLYWELHGEPLGIGDSFGYYAEDYPHTKLDYMISGDYKTAPNGKKALVIYYDAAKPV